MNISNMNNEINQEYVNRNIDDIIKFMLICKPDEITSVKNWKFSLLKDYKPKIWIVISYQKYTEGVNMKNNYTDRVDKFYDKEQELETKIENEAPIMKNLEEQSVEWRKITRLLTCKLKEYISAREYLEFVHQLPSYYGL